MPGAKTRPWIGALSPAAVRDAVRAVVPDLARAEVELNVGLEPTNPFWQRGTAWLGNTHVVKFAWSAEAALELARERRAMLALARTRFARWMPIVEAASERPLLIVTRRVEGVPCWGVILDDPSVARDVAAALADLHNPGVRTAIRNEGIEPPAPAPQADTDAIRSGLDRYLDQAELQLVRRWCDWTDHVQARPTGDRVILHGDLHGYNLLVRGGRMRCVLDYDAVSAGDPHYDLRYLPGLESSIGFLVAVVDEYERRTGRAVEPAPLLAWHIRTVLGDALWRSEAGVPLPGGGTVHDWIEALRLRIARLAAWRAFDCP